MDLFDGRTAGQSTVVRRRNLMKNSRRRVAETGRQILKIFGRVGRGSVNDVRCRSTHRASTFPNGRRTTSRASPAPRKSTPPPNAPRSCRSITRAASPTGTPVRPTPSPRSPSRWTRSSGRPGRRPIRTSRPTHRTSTTTTCSTSFARPCWAMPVRWSCRLQILGGVEFAAKGYLEELKPEDVGYATADFWPGALKSVT